MGEFGIEKLHRKDSHKSFSSQQSVMPRLNRSITAATSEFSSKGNENVNPFGTKHR